MSDTKDYPFYSTTHHICGASEQYVHVSPASEEGA